MCFPRRRCRAPRRPPPPPSTAACSRSRRSRSSRSSRGWSRARAAATATARPRRGAPPPPALRAPAGAAPPAAARRAPAVLRAAGLEALAYDADRRAELEERAAAGFSHPLFEKSPGGAIASAQRTARWRPLVDRVAADHDLRPQDLEALI